MSEIRFYVVFDNGQWVAVALDQTGVTRHLFYGQSLEQAVMAIAAETGRRVIVPVEIMQP